MLLDNFIRAVSLEKSKAYELEEQAQMMAMGVSKADRANPMEPLLEALSHYKSEVLLFFFRNTPAHRVNLSFLSG